MDVDTQPLPADLATPRRGYDWLTIVLVGALGAAVAAMLGYALTVL